MNDDPLSRSKQDWESETLEPTLKRFPERRDTFTTSSGIPLRRLYSPEDVDQDYLRRLGFPGEPPFTRGVQPTMYRGRLWTMRQYAGFGSAVETNQRFHYLLEQGQTGLSIAFDLPTQIGYDADDPLATGEVGKVGVSISSLDDMDLLFKDIPLEDVSTSMTINSSAAILLAMYIALAKKRGISLNGLRGTIQNDILKEYIARGTYIFPPKPAMRLITDVFQYCHREMPRWNTISISGYHIREAGSTAVQEVAFTLSNAIAYVEAALQAGLQLEKFVPQLAFFFNAHNNFLEEIAKFRAARRLWSEIVKNRFGSDDPRCMRLRFHTQTAGSALTAQQPENNIVRVTLQALAAVLGGTQSLHTNSMDEALSLPTEKAVQIALRTQQIIAHESGVADTIDPIAGSFAVEALTAEIHRLSEEYIHKIDDLGGALVAIEAGFLQGEIQEAAYQAQKAVESRESLVVGVNEFTLEDEPKIEILRVNPEIERDQKQRLATLRTERDASVVENALTQLQTVAESDQNLIPIFIHCVESSVTLGEICNRLRQVWGEYRPIVTL